MTLATAILKVTALCVAAAGAATAQPPVAVVEDVTGHPAGVQMMDYVTPGQVIALGPSDSIILGYLTSCARETITGGKVTVGTDHSEIVGGTVQRNTIQCHGGKMELTAQVAEKSASMIIREVPQFFHREVKPQLTIYGQSPIVQVHPIGALVIERIDAPAERLDILLPDAQLINGKFLDFAATGVTLAPGGLYKARVGMQEIVFRVDPGAQPGRTPVAGRLLQLQP